MFNAYEIAIKLSMLNAVSPQLKLMQGQFAALSLDAEVFQNRLSKIKSLAMVGGSMFAAGLFGAYGIDKMMQPAIEYEHQLNILKMAGLSQLEIAQATAKAWQTTHDVITSSATDNLKAFMDMRNVLGNTQEAIALMPMIAKMQAVLMSSKEGNALASSSNFAQDFAFSVVKSMDILGKAIDPKEFIQQATEMSKVITAFQGRVTPQAYQQTIAYARQSRFGFDDEFIYRFLPTLMLEYSKGNQGGSGGSKGVGPMLAAFYRVTNQGYINRKSLPLLEQLGLVDPNTALLTTTSGTTVGKFKNSDLAARDPFLWVQQVLMPAIYKNFGDNLSKLQIGQIINEIFRGQQNASTLALEYALKPQNFYRDAQIIAKSMSTPFAYNQAIKNDPQLAMLALSKQWNTFLTAMMIPVVTNLLIPTLMVLTSWLNKLSDILLKYPNIAKYLTFAFIGLTGALLFGGTVVLLTAAFQGLGLVLKLIGFGAFSLLGPLGSLILALAAPIIPIVGIIAGFGLVGYAAYKLFHMLADNGWKNDWNFFLKTLDDLWGRIKSLFHGILNLLGIGHHDKNNHILKNITQPKVVYDSIKHDYEYVSNPNRLNVIPPQNTNNNQQPINVVMKVNHDVLGKVTVNHMARNINKIPNNSSSYDTAMNYVPVLLQSSQLF